MPDSWPSASGQLSAGARKWKGPVSKKLLLINPVQEVKVTLGTLIRG